MYENVIAVPYRNREAHLAYFLQHTVPLIRAHLPGSRVVVVEQAPGKPFNRGAVLNVAFKEFENRTKYFFTHDVDINPTRRCIEEYYTRSVVGNGIMGIYTSAYNTLGGIIKTTATVMRTINGFPNDIWGWGAEDKALQNRAEYFGIGKQTNLMSNRHYPEYILRFNDVDDRDKSNHDGGDRNCFKQYVQWPKHNKATKERIIMESGLNNLKYTVLDRKNLNDMVELIKVRI